MTATAAREKVFERLVAWIWEQQMLVGPLPADDGRWYQVVFRGRGWGERSPDFQGALLARDDGLLLRGDVEIHVRASDWKRHGHSRNSAYNQTICQVVLWQDEAPPVVREDGTTIPTVELVTRLAAPLAELEQQAGLTRRHPARRQRPGPVPLAAGDDEEQVAAEQLAILSADDGFSGPTRPPSLACVQSPADLADLLDRAGVARFLEHAATFESDLACLPPEDVLYRGVLRAMGYTANTHGFEQLGRALPLDVLRSVASERPGPAGALGRDGTCTVRAVQAALLGVAGLLPSQRGLSADAGWPRLLESAWAGQADGLSAPLPLGTWRTWRVRPENVPVRRLAGISQLIGGWSAGDPLDRLLDDLAAAEHAANLAVLARRWQARVEDDGYWSHHHDFGRPLPTPQPWLGGAGRAGEVVVNVLLPFAYALGQASSGPGAGGRALSARALALYRRYPSGPLNRVVREMAVQVGGKDGPKLAKGACRQQGLIHLYRHWCDSRDCARCAAGPG